MESKVEIIKPFGARIFKLELLEEVYQKLMDITDKLIIDKNRKSHGDKLAGQIKEEIEIDLTVLNDNNLYGYFIDCLRGYIEYCLKSIGAFDPKVHKIYCDLTSMWFNEMQPNGEYNPVHYHSGCHVSSTLYLKIPSSNPNRGIKYKKDYDGNIEFIDRSVAPDYLQRPSIGFTPKERTMYMWPSNLLHTVYPFLGDEVRRSIAWNGTYRLINKETGGLVLGGSPWPKN